MADDKFPRPTDEDHDVLRDAFEDLRLGGYTTLHPTDPDKILYWLERYYGLDAVVVHLESDQALILFRPYA